MKKRNFVLPIEVMDVYKDIQIMRNEEEARQFLESVMVKKFMNQKNWRDLSYLLMT